LKILSIQSWVSAGHVGNSAAIFPLQRLGAEVAAIHTVQFSNHPGHGAFTGRVYPAGDTQALVAGLDAHGTLAQCDGLLTGYVGDAATGHAILNAANRMRAANQAALWCCDPVMGDDNRLYVNAEIPTFFSTLAVPAADLLTPNQFELGLLTGMPCDTLAQARDAACALQAQLRPQGPRVVLVTSLAAAEDDPSRLHMLLAAGSGAFVLTLERLPAKFSGAGDTLAALFLLHMLESADPVHAAERAAASLAGVLRRTLQAGATELLTVAAQNEFVSPSVTLHAEPC
jgi:pyridoxine kinase